MWDRRNNWPTNTTGRKRTSCRYMTSWPGSSPPPVRSSRAGHCAWTHACSGRLPISSSCRRPRNCRGSKWVTSRPIFCRRWCFLKRNLRIAKRLCSILACAGWMFTRWDFCCPYRIVSLRIRGWDWRPADISVKLATSWQIERQWKYRSIVGRLPVRILLSGHSRETFLKVSVNYFGYTLGWNSFRTFENLAPPLSICCARHWQMRLEASGYFSQIGYELTDWETVIVQINCGTFTS